MYSVGQFKDNSDRRNIGLGFVGKFCGREYREENIDERIQKEMEALIEYRYSTALYLILTKHSATTDFFRKLGIAQLHSIL